MNEGMGPAMAVTILLSVIALAGLILWCVWGVVT